MNGVLCKMFGALCMKRLPLAYCSQICSIRTDFRRRRNRQPRPNPGIENRMKILKMESPDLDKLEQEEINLDDLESDFMEVGDMHEDFEREKKSAAHKLAFVITKSKHFKQPKLPNLLIWTEKEQIRDLHRLDPIEWSPEKLSQKFPATPEIVKKLVKSHWKPRSDADVERHDRSVQRNWSDLLKGKFNLDQELKHHLLSFSTRQQILPKVSSSDNKQIVIHNKPQGSREFSDIVSNYVKEKSPCENQQLEVSIPDLTRAKLSRKSCDPKSDSFVVPGASHFKRELLPLSEYKEKVLTLMEEEDEGDELARKYYDHLKKGIAEEEDEDLNCEKGLQLEEKLPEMTKKLQKYKRMGSDNNLLPQQLDVYMKAERYKMKIKIPAEKFDPSAVYKVKDCFYDADGKFLYRVPGMS